MSGEGRTHSPDRFYPAYKDLNLQIKSSYAFIIKIPYNLCKDEFNQLCSKMEESIEWLSKKQHSIDSDDEKTIRKMVTSIFKQMLIYTNKLLEKFQHSKSKTHNKFDLMESDSMKSVYNLLREKNYKLLPPDIQDYLTKQVAHEFFENKMLSKEKLKECFSNMRRKYATLKVYDQNRSFSLLLRAACEQDEDGNILPKYPNGNYKFEDENQTVKL